MNLRGSALTAPQSSLPAGAATARLSVLPGAVGSGADDVGAGVGSAAAGAAPAPTETMVSRAAAVAAIRMRIRKGIPPYDSVPKWGRTDRCIDRRPLATP